MIIILLEIYESDKKPVNNDTDSSETSRQIRP